MAENWIIQELYRAITCMRAYYNVCPDMNITMILRRALKVLLDFRTKV